MVSLLERKLIVVTGKGGAGKSTVACALGLLAASYGRRTIVVELADQQRLPVLFHHAQTPTPGMETQLEDDLWSTSIDPDEALIEWLRTLGGRVSARVLAASGTFQYFAAAAPGAKELVSMIKLRELCEGRRNRAGRGSYDLVILDAPATGHALAMLRSPQTFAAIVRGGPLTEQAERVQGLLEDRSRSACIAVAQGTDMAVTETLEFEQGLRQCLNRDPDLIVVNATMPRRFTRAELTLIAKLDGGMAQNAQRGASLTRGVRPTDASRDARVTHAAALAARSAHERARVQQNQIARLRRKRIGDSSPPEVVSIPFTFSSELALSELRAIAQHLDRSLGR